MEITLTRGRENPEMVLFCARLNTSLTVPPSTPFWSSLAQVNAYWASSPCQIRWVTFIWSESYQVRPCGAQSGPKPLENCGYGRRDCATEDVSGNPAYGNLFWNRPAAADPMGARRIARSAALLMSRPIAASPCGVRAL